jgi:hypothetical protein
LKIKAILLIIGVNIKKLKDGLYEFIQSMLIDSIIDDIRLKVGQGQASPSKGVNMAARIKR